MKCVQRLGILGVTTLQLLFSACVGNREVSAQSGTDMSPAADTSLFAAAVRAIYDGPVEGFLRVDPRPLRADPKLVTLNSALARAVPDRVTASSSPLAEVPAEVIRRRSEVLERLGVRQTDALDRPACAGLVPWDRRPSIREGCPKEGQIKVAILGVPRPGGAYPPSSLDEREEGLRQGYWTVRVIEKLLGPQGATSTTSDFVFEENADGTGWRLVKRVGLLWTD